jgi:hypothetical protein
VDAGCWLAKTSDLFCVLVIGFVTASLVGACTEDEVNVTPHGIRALAQDHVVVDTSPDPETTFLGSPGIVRLGSGRLVVTADAFGEGVASLPGPKARHPDTGGMLQGRVYTSDDGGQSWTYRTAYPFFHARPFVAGETLYIIGHAGDLHISVSYDQGSTWSAPVALTSGQGWTGAADNVWYANGNVYLAMERRYERGLRECWRVGDIAPVLLRAPIHVDLTVPENWTMASSPVFEDLVTPDSLDYVGIPFFESLPDRANWLTPERPMSPMGWLETNVVQFTDPDHIWTDTTGHTFHLFMRAHTGRTGFAAVARVVELDDGTMETTLERSPSGERILYTPFPGGQMKFYVLYDEVTKLFWLVNTQATDSMIRLDRMPEDRYNLPDNERRRLVLHYSKNMIDWVFAGLVAIGPSERSSRHYASMTIDGDDLLIVSRSGDENALNAHNGNLITFHRVADFRELVY